MVQLKIVFDTRRQKADGTFPIVYRITDVKKVFYIPSGISVKMEHWNTDKLLIGKNHPNAQALNTSLSKRYYEIQKAIMSLEHENRFSFEELKLLTVHKKDERGTPTFNEFTEKLINDLLRVRKTGNAIVYRTALNRLLKYTNNKRIKFTDINYNLLEGFNHYLLADGVKVNTVSNYLRAIRAIYNKGIKAKLADRSNSPFYDLSIKTERTAKRAVAREHIRKIEEKLLDKGTQEWEARNYFLLSFYLIGISFTDLAYLTKDNIVNGRLEYRRRKTHKLYSIKLVDKAKLILRRYAVNGCKYLLPVLPSTILEDSIESRRIIQQWIKTTNKYLRRITDDLKIQEDITTYVARHTWATIAKRLGYSNELIAEAMGHEYGNKITNIYLDSFDKEVIDKMHEAVIS